MHKEMQNRLLLMLILSILISGCVSPAPTAEAEDPPSATTTPSPLPTAEATPTQTPVLIPEATPTASPVVTKPGQEGQPNCGEAFCQLDWPGYLIRPISGEYRTTIDPFYPYASTKGGILDAHHGVEFPNAFGTPVRAAADGEVIFAGKDDLDVLGPFTGFYGNVVILRHPELYQGRDLFSLYAHLSEIHVEEGTAVFTGDELGKVGASGAADGSHLHFEVRVDENTYDRTSNPVLWFKPAQDPGAMLAGQILDRSGQPLSEFEFVLERKNEIDGQPERYYPVTYVSYDVNGHPLLDENFAVADLPPGDYRLALIAGRFYQFDFSLVSGQLGFLHLQLD